MPRPASESASNEQYLARWYETFLDLCKAAKRRNLGIIAHPSHKAALMDMMERVAEDPLWNMGDLPPLTFYTRMEPGKFQFIDPTTSQILTATEAMRSGKGLGRFKTVNTPDEALRSDP